ncbi:hypothetical protein DFH06DRAFT_1123584 [Mycena polygramma]|nr:hypothetical protein DFH06DRAFT_1123584 [Mycena polygramma]
MYAVFGHDDRVPRIDAQSDPPPTQSQADMTTHKATVVERSDGIPPGSLLAKLHVNSLTEKRTVKPSVFNFVRCWRTFGAPAFLTIWSSPPPLTLRRAFGLPPGQSAFALRVSSSYTRRYRPVDFARRGLGICSRLRCLHHHFTNIDSISLTPLMARICRLAARAPLEAAEAYLNIRPYKEHHGVVYTHLRPNHEVLDNAADVPDEEELDWVDLKVGKAEDIVARRGDYEAVCVGEPIIWGYYYETSHPKLIERLTHLTLWAMDAKRVPYPCHGCGVRHREHFSEAKSGGLDVVAAVIEYWLGRLGEQAYPSFLIVAHSYFIRELYRLENFTRENCIALNPDVRSKEVYKLDIETQLDLSGRYNGEERDKTKSRPNEHLAWRTGSTIVDSRFSLLEQRVDHKHRIIYHIDRRGKTQVKWRRRSQPHWCGVRRKQDAVHHVRVAVPARVKPSNFSHQSPTLPPPPPPSTQQGADLRVARSISAGISRRLLESKLLEPDLGQQLRHKRRILPLVQARFGGALELLWACLQAALDRLIDPRSRVLSVLNVVDAIHTILNPPPRPSTPPPLRARQSFPILSPLSTQARRSTPSPHRSLRTRQSVPSLSPLSPTPSTPPLRARQSFPYISPLSGYESPRHTLSITRPQRDDETSLTRGSSSSSRQHSARIEPDARGQTPPARGRLRKREDSPSPAPKRKRVRKEPSHNTNVEHSRKLA